MNHYSLENKVRRLGKVTLMTRVMGFGECLSDMSEWDPFFVIHDGDGMAHMGRPTAPYLSLDSCLSCPIDLGSPSVSP